MGGLEPPPGYATDDTWNKVREVGDDDIQTLTQYDRVQYNELNTAYPNILLIKVLRSHLQ